MALKGQPRHRAQGRERRAQRRNQPVLQRVYALIQPAGASCLNTSLIPLSKIPCTQRLCMLRFICPDQISGRQER